MRIKEPYLLAFSVLWLLASVLPKKINRGRSGIPYENQTVARAGMIGIGLAMLLLWYSLPAH
ncbi:MAG: hypothetical protein DMG90_03120 [Acidobacteria bacterium]|nr:MAG: hypothetical protein DMG91_04870 [Acidobacteriota bacterium]PYV93052.1 MAG: hypothetical protein DMG90_03120 [Acidobacteriota bacterium]